MLRLRRFGLTLLAATLAAWIGCAPRAAETGSGGKPQYGGTLNLGMIRSPMSTLSWAGGDLDWNVNHDTSAVYEQLFAADPSKFQPDAGEEAASFPGYLSEDLLHGELAESWEWRQNPLRIEIKLREGVMFPDKPGIMHARELVAADVVAAFQPSGKAAKKNAKYRDHIEKIEALDPHTVAITFKSFDAQWARGLLWGDSSAISPKEVFDAGMTNWQHANGSGPFMLADLVPDTDTFTKNPVYWDKQAIGRTVYKLPFVDEIVYHTIKVEAPWDAALRAGKLDILEGISWQNADELRKSAPQLQWRHWLATDGTFLALRVDVDGPLKDIRVRRALNMAVNKQDIIATYYKGNAALFAYPEHPNFAGYYEPLETMPDSVKALFTYNPDQARKLLAEAGYPNGFSFKVMVCSCNADHMGLLPLVAAWLKQVGVKVEIQPMEYAAFVSAMTARTTTASYLLNSSHTNPVTSIRDGFTTGQQRNASGWSDPEFDQRVEDAYDEPDLNKRQAIVRELTRDILDKAPYIWLPTPYAYTAWWPWVRNYGAGLAGSAVRPGPVYARIWIDQDMKKAMGH